MEGVISAKRFNKKSLIRNAKSLLQRLGLVVAHLTGETYEDACEIIEEFQLKPLERIAIKTRRLDEEHLTQFVELLLQLILTETSDSKERFITLAVAQLTGEVYEKARVFVEKVQSEMECSHS